ncbi:MAG: hypothetical protein KF729_22445 [Sandaracinaceae bacterium]|nr:hypothetical protein [Sandaracinaceae bacterium]
MSEKDEDEGGVTDSEEAMRWAAEEPTAMWDESFLEREGFDALLKDRAANPREETGPATVEGAGGKSRTGSVEISSEVTGGHPAVSAPRKRRSGGLSWALTLVVAITLGFAVYALVRLLR